MAVATQCNKQRWSAKCAQEECNDLYLARHIEQNQPFIQDAIVINVTKRFFTILVGATGSIISLYPEVNSLQTIKDKLLSKNYLLFRRWVRTFNII